MPGDGLCTATCSQVRGLVRAEWANYERQGSWCCGVLACRRCADSLQPGGKAFGTQVLALSNEARVRM